MERGMTMNIIVVKNPGSENLFSIWSSQIDQFVALNLNERQVGEWFAIAGREHALAILRQLENGENPYGEYGLTFDQFLQIQKEFSPEAVEPPVVNPSFKKAS